MAKASDVSRGNFIRFNGELMQVEELEHRTPGNLRAFYQMKMRNVKNGKVFENRFRPDETVEIVRVEVKEMMYSYRDGENLVCMDNETYEQVYINEVAFGEAMQFLKEGIVVKVSFDDSNTAISVELPASVELLITYAEPGVKGDTATKTLKPATLETGAVISVPLFVNEGELIKVNTTTGEYMERVK
ncbi:MAG: elongation factor P [Thermonemataceae bacterium]|nr:elongation factor P [Thermonemataceae bacterium]